MEPERITIDVYLDLSNIPCQLGGFCDYCGTGYPEPRCAGQPRVCVDCKALAARGPKTRAALLRARLAGLRGDAVRAAAPQEEAANGA